MVVAGDCCWLLEISNDPRRCFQQKSGPRLIRLETLFSTFEAKGFKVLRSLNRMSSSLIHDEQRVAMSRSLSALEERIGVREMHNRSSLRSRTKLWVQGPSRIWPPPVVLSTHASAKCAASKVRQVHAKRRKGLVEKVRYEAVLCLPQDRNLAERLKTFQG